MKDLNFFTAPERKKDKSAVGLITIILVVFLICCSVAFYFVMQNQINLLKTDINKINDSINAPEVKEKMAGIEATKQKLQLIKEYQANFELVDHYLTDSYKLSGTMMDSIRQAAPLGVEYKSMNSSSKEIILEIVAPDQLAIASFVHNLKGLKYFTTVDLSDSGNDPTTSSKVANIHCQLKDVMPK